MKYTIFNKHQFLIYELSLYFSFRFSLLASSNEENTASMSKNANENSSRVFMENKQYIIELLI